MRRKTRSLILFPLLLAAGAFGVFIAVIYAGMFGPLPDREDREQMENATASLVLSVDGSIIYEHTQNQPAKRVISEEIKALPGFDHPPVPASLPVDQGIEHTGDSLFGPNPIYFDPGNIIKLAIGGRYNAVATMLGDPALNAFVHCN